MATLSAEKLITEVNTRVLAKPHRPLIKLAQEAAIIHQIINCSPRIRKAELQHRSLRDHVQFSVSEIQGTIDRYSYEINYIECKAKEEHKSITTENGILNDLSCNTERVTQKDEDLKIETFTFGCA